MDHHRTPPFTMFVRQRIQELDIQVIDQENSGRPGASTNWDNVYNSVLGRHNQLALNDRRQLQRQNMLAKLAEDLPLSSDEDSFLNQSNYLSSTPVLKNGHHGASAAQLQQLSRISVIPKRTPLRSNSSLMNIPNRELKERNSTIVKRKSASSFRDEPQVSTKKLKATRKSFEARVSAPNFLPPRPPPQAPSRPMLIDPTNYLNSFRNNESPFNSPYTPNTLRNLDQQRTMYNTYYASRMMTTNQSGFPHSIPYAEEVSLRDAANQTSGPFGQSNDDLIAAIELNNSVLRKSCPSASVNESPIKQCLFANTHEHDAANLSLVSNKQPITNDTQPHQLAVDYSNDMSCNNSGHDDDDDDDEDEDAVEDEQSEVVPKEDQHKEPSEKSLSRKSSFKQQLPKDEQPHQLVANYSGNMSLNNASHEDDDGAFEDEPSSSTKLEVALKEDQHKEPSEKSLSRKLSIKQLVADYSNDMSWNNAAHDDDDDDDEDEDEDAVENEQSEVVPKEDQHKEPSEKSLSRKLSIKQLVADYSNDMSWNNAAHDDDDDEDEDEDAVENEQSEVVPKEDQHKEPSEKSLSRKLSIKQLVADYSNDMSWNNAAHDDGDEHFEDEPSSPMNSEVIPREDQHKRTSEPKKNKKSRQVNRESLKRRIYENLISCDDIIRPVDNSMTRVLRRSKRNRTRPLNYWANQRPLYKMECDQRGVAVPTLVGVSREKREPVVLRKKAKSTAAKRTRNTEPELAEPHLRMDNILDLSIHNPKLAKKLASSAESEHDSVLAYGKIEFKESKGSPGIFTAITRKVSNIAFGKLKFAAKSEKRTTKTGSYVTYFNVVYGTLLLKLGDDKVGTVVKTGYYFQVDKDTNYSIKNLRDDDAIIDFTIVKEA